MRPHELVGSDSHIHPSWNSVEGGIFNSMPAHLVGFVDAARRWVPLWTMAVHRAPDASPGTRGV
eukprot:UN2774